MGFRAWGSVVKVLEVKGCQVWAVLRASDLGHLDPLILLQFSGKLKENLLGYARIIVINTKRFKAYLPYYGAPVAFACQPAILARASSSACHDVGLRLRREEGLGSTKTWLNTWRVVGNTIPQKVETSVCLSLSLSLSVFVHT